ncbi:hypothetical protein PTQ33_01630 [Campylobacter sp. 50012-21]|uniref:hypothetical protein n=1 Tax=Campylobacter magnus TaxID=3026462 RepID=UPI0023617113|nr:hypothetical protein [Campylobacter magnus]MDD0845824.1 hypothetical protein [Campylobacter magnus]
MGLIKANMLKDEIRTLIENALMDLGYVKFSIDMDALKADISAGKADELKDFVEVNTTYSIVPAKIKFLLVSGNNIFAKKDAIKALGFRWDGKTKQRYRQRNYLAL